jgi:hypothetical protein
MNHHATPTEHLLLTRRDFVRRSGMGMGMLALGGIFGQHESPRRAQAVALRADGKARHPHFSERRRVAGGHL